MILKSKVVSSHCSDAIRRCHIVRLPGAGECLLFLKKVIHEEGSLLGRLSKLPTSSQCATQLPSYRGMYAGAPTPRQHSIGQPLLSTRRVTTGETLRLALSDRR